MWLIRAVLKLILFNELVYISRNAWHRPLKIFHLPISLFNKLGNTSVELQFWRIHHNLFRIAPVSGSMATDHHVREYEIGRTYCRRGRYKKYRTIQKCWLETANGREHLEDTKNGCKKCCVLRITWLSRLDSMARSFEHRNELSTSKKVRKHLDQLSD